MTPLRIKVEYDKLVLKQVYLRPVAEVQTLAVERDAMYSGWNERSHRLMVEGKPTHIGDGDLLGFVIEGDTCLPCRLLRLRDGLVEGGIAPLPIIVGRTRCQIQRQPVIGVGEVRTPLSETELHLMIGRF